MFTHYDWTGRYGKVQIVSLKFKADGDIYWLGRCDCGGEVVVTSQEMRSRRDRQRLQEMQCEECVPRQKGDRYLLDKWRLWSRTGPGVVAEWADFVAFRRGVGRRRSGHYLCWPDRSRPFGPDNFVWARGEERLRYQPGAKAKLIKGEWLTIGQRMRRNGITYDHYRKRRKRGWTPDEACGPKDYRGSRRRYKPKPKRQRKR